MDATAFYTWELPSFRTQAALRLGELSALLISLQLTEPWDSALGRQVLDDARLIRHGLRSTRDDSGLTLDERRYIVQRLLPMLPLPRTAGGVPSVPIPSHVPVQLVLGAVVDGTMQQAQAISGRLAPADSYLRVLRDNTVLARSDANQPAGPRELLFTDAEPGTQYRAELLHEGRVLGFDTKMLQLPNPELVYWTTAPTTAPVPSNPDVFQQAPVQPKQALTFVLPPPTGRHNLYMVIPASYQWQLQDAALNNLNISAAFTAQPITFAGKSCLLLKQGRPVISPISVTLTLLLS